MIRNATVALALVLAVLAVYGQALGFAFVDYDDPNYVTKNDVVQRGLTLDGAAWTLTHEHGANWHPVTSLSHMLDCELFGLRPGGHHATSVLLHAANALLLFGWLASATRAPWRSALVAALFALHPLRVESVAWISERKDVLSTFFGLLALWNWTAWTRRGGAWRYLAAVIALALGLMAKPMLVTLPFVMLLLDWWPLERARTVPLQRRLLEKLPLLLLSAGACVMTVVAQRTAGAVRVDQIPLGLRIANGAVSYARYLGKTVWPSDLGVLYIHPNLPGGTPWTAAQIAGAAALVLAITAAVLATRRSSAIVGWLWFLGTLVPVLGLVQVGEQAMADRYTYVPSIGLFVAAVWGACEALAALERRGMRRARGIAAVAAGAILLALLLQARAQARTWRDSQALFDRAYAVEPTSAMVLTHLGSLRQDHGDYAGAIEYYRRAIAIQPEHITANYNLGFALQSVGQLDEAVRQYERAIELAPNHAFALNNLGNVLQQRGQTEAAIERYLAALEYLPEFADAEMNLANALRSLGRAGEAREHYERSLAIDPRYAGTHYNLGSLLLESGDVAAALPHLREAVRLEPDQVAFAYHLGWILATSRDPALRSPSEAVLLFERASASTGHSDPAIFDGLAAAYAASGKFDVAVSNAETALSLALASGQPEVAEIVRSRLALYRRGEAYTSP